MAAKKNKKAEPTLTDVLEVVQAGFGRMDADFGEMHQRIEKVERVLRAIHLAQQTHIEDTQDIKKHLAGLK